jgi:hypothetical protein
MVFADFLGLGIATLLFLLLVALVVFIFEIVMFIDAILNKNISDEARILWVIGMLLIHPFVAIAYFFTDHKKRL